MTPDQKSIVEDMARGIMSTMKPEPGEPTACSVCKSSSCARHPDFAKMTEPGWSAFFELFASHSSARSWLRMKLDELDEAGKKKESEAAAASKPPSASPPTPKKAAISRPKRPSTPPAWSSPQSEFVERMAAASAASFGAYEGGYDSNMARAMAVVCTCPACKALQIAYATTARKASEAAV